jgi:lipoprotein-anchoring transpeptidase ErfK/SrfK
MLLAGASVLTLAGTPAQAQTVTWGASGARPPDMMRPEPAFRYRPDPAFSYRPPPAYSYTPPPAYSYRPEPAFRYTPESASRSKKAKPSKPAKTRVVSIRTYAPARPRPVIEISTETRRRTEITASTPPKPVDIKTEAQPEVVAAPAPVVEIRPETAPPQTIAAVTPNPVVETEAEIAQPKVEIASPSQAATPAQPKPEFKIEIRQRTTIAAVPPAPVIPAKIEPLAPAKPIVEAKAEPTQPPETTGTLRIIREENVNTARNSGTGKKGKKAEEKPAATSGQLHIIVSIDHQRATLYSNGHFVASTKVSTGTKTHPTPLGVFSVLQKNRHHISNLYDAPMPYMQRLTWSGTAMHTGPLPGYPASHGCIRLPDSFAQMLWKATKIGARVIVTRDDVKPIEFAHTRLLVPKPKSEQASAPAKPLVRTADATSSVSETKSDQTPADGDPAEQPVDPRTMVVEAIASSTEVERRASPVSIFVSRKDGKLYVRQGMQPLFDVPLTLRDPLQPIGTHVYTAMELKDGAMRWTAVTIPSGFGGEPEKKRGKTEAPAVQLPPSSAAAALERLDIPAETAERLATMLIPGSSLIVSDNGIGGETGQGTDFIVLTR